MAPRPDIHPEDPEEEEEEKISTVVVPELPEELKAPLAAVGRDAVEEVAVPSAMREEDEEEEEEEVEEQVFPLHREWSDRFRKTLYYGGCGAEDLPSTDRSSLSLTEICVEEFEGATADCCRDATFLTSNAPEEEEEEEVGAALLRVTGSDREEEEDEEGGDSLDEDERRLLERRRRQRQRRRRRRRRRRATLSRLDVSRTAELSMNTHASPASLVVALLYLDRLRTANPTYLGTVSSTDLFLVSLMVASKFLNDDGEDDEVFNDEWAEAAGMELKELNRCEQVVVTRNIGFFF